MSMLLYILLFSWRVIDQFVIYRYQGYQMSRLFRPLEHADRANGFRY